MKYPNRFLIRMHINMMPRSARYHECIERSISSTSTFILCSLINCFLDFPIVNNDDSKFSSSRDFLYDPNEIYIRLDYHWYSSRELTRIFVHTTGSMYKHVLRARLVLPHRSTRTCVCRVSVRYHAAQQLHVRWTGSVCQKVKIYKMFNALTIHLRLFIAPFCDSVERCPRTPTKSIQVLWIKKNPIFSSPNR